MRPFRFATLLHAPIAASLMAAASPAPGQTMHTHWAKIGGWNMSTTNQKTVVLAGHVNVVGITVIIHSDPVTVNGTPRVEVDRFDRTGIGGSGFAVTPDNFNGRGGEYFSSTGSYVTLKLGPTTQGSIGEQRNRFMLGRHTNTSVNRGWVRLDYVGTPVNTSQPYAVKSKVITIGSWDMSAKLEHDVDFSNFGHPANRITSFNTTMISGDKSIITDIIRTGPTGEFGGIAVITDKASPPKAAMRIHHFENFFNGYYYGWNFRNTDNRGYIKVDYLAAECNEGSGYTRSFIGFTPDANDCHGNRGTGASAVHVVQTKGADIWNASDKFAFIRKTSRATNLTIKARVDKIENTNSWARAGIMMRASLNANSRHVAMVVTPKPEIGNGNGIGFTVRGTDGGNTTESSPNTLSAPYWVLIEKTGNTFRGYMSATGTGDPYNNPASWTQVGTAATVNFPGSNTDYYIGLCQTAGNNSPVLLNTSVYSGLNF